MQNHFVAPVLHTYYWLSGYIFLVLYKSVFLVLKNRMKRGVLLTEHFHLLTRIYCFQRPHKISWDLSSIKCLTHILLFAKWKFSVTWWCKCGFELLWVLQNSTAWKNEHKAPCWGNWISCTERRSEPIPVWSDLFFFGWVTITDVSNMPFIYHHLLHGVYILMPYLPEQRISMVT